MAETRGIPNTAGRIYWVGGSKGGVGKSLMTVAIFDYLIARGEEVFLVECDTSNPDVWKAYQEHVKGDLIDLDRADGWIQFVNACHARRNAAVVVNSAARNNIAVTHYGPTLDSSLDELGTKLVTLWMITGSATAWSYSPSSCRPCRRRRRTSCGYHKPMRYFSLVALVTLAGFSCNSPSSPSYGTPEDCSAAGGQCVLTAPGNMCAKMGPENTCNCNPTCTSGGAFCCIEFIDAGDAGEGD